MNFGYPVADYYGKLLCDNLATFRRLSDALFMYMDQSCDIPELRCTGYIEPAKHAQFAVSMGAPQAMGQWLQDFLGSYYHMAVPSYIYSSQFPVLDQEAWFHLQLFNAKLNPDRAHQEWSAQLSRLNLYDSIMNCPFPTYMNRQCFPPYPDNHRSSFVSGWLGQAKQYMDWMVTQSHYAPMPVNMSHWQQPYTVTHPQPYAVTYHRPYAVTHQQHHNWNGHGHGAGGGGKKKPDYMEWMKIGAPIAFHIADIVISGGALSGLLSNVFNGDFFNGLNF